MGRRKERKLAVVGRRVKLDLFAEPSGDLGGEFGGVEESKLHADSPSSSGKQPENPLLLLGQYSDDEADEESSEQIKHAASEDSSLDLEDQGKQSAKEHNNVNGEVHSTVLEVEEQAVDNGSDLPGPSDRLAEDSTKENNAADSVDLSAHMCVMGHIIAPATSDKQVLGDASSGWKMVLHEESNHYYYWNVVTGETSWEVPTILGHSAEPQFEERITADTEYMGNTTSANVESSANLDTDIKHTGVSYSNISEDRQPIEDAFHAEKGDYNENKSDTISESEQIDSQHNETSSPGGSLSSGQSGHTLTGHLNGSGEDSTKYRDADYVHEDDETEADFSSDLVKHCERLLEQLKTMKGSEFYAQMHDQISKYALELEIRLADIKSLACNGLSLLPFWVHSEKKIKQLDSEINQFCGQLIYGQKSDVKAGHESLGGSEHVQDSNGERPNHPASSNASEEDGAAGVSVHEELTPQTLLHPAEGVDMDVDMEVEDTEPSRSLTPGNALHAPNHVPNHTPLDTAILSVPQTKLESLAPEQTSSSPPPPDEDWIPPPPPDNEPFPPPPPDEPLDHTPSDMESVQPFSYNLAYPGSAFEYCGQLNPEVASSLYAIADGQIAVSHQPLYYQIPSTYSAAPVVINHVAPTAYYGHQDGALQPASVFSGAESSGLPAITVNENVAPDAIPSLDVHGGARSDLLAKTEADVPVNLEAENMFFDVPATQSSFQYTESVSAIEGVAMSSTSVINGSVASASTAPSKVQSKVVRNKKRTAGVVSTLRSNKKVSSLVDKWKAAKEELHAEEEAEPESALEKLEKKRQREIEEWRARQISSGEAKDNANFQPLGADWRERVKRKRAEKMREAEKKPPEENEQPDLHSLSRGLPSGWQAYWDDSSKQVYYGNAVTSETTWNRPCLNLQD